MYMNAQKLMTLYALTALSFGVSTQAEARSYIVERFDTYTVRCSSIQASELPNKVIDTYDVREPSDDTGIISCVLQEEDADHVMPNIEGSFTGYLQNLIGHRTTLNFRPVLENNAVTYIATYERTSTSPVRFWMTVSTGESKHEFEFQDSSE
ncbi:MAG: hypothetical protein ACJAYC_000659 [Halieaceae bacterium]|jgi:hypothetical protein